MNQVRPKKAKVTSYFSCVVLRFYVNPQSHVAICDIKSVADCLQEQRGPMAGSGGQKGGEATANGVKPGKGTRTTADKTNSQRMIREQGRDQVVGRVSPKGSHSKACLCHTVLSHTGQFKHCLGSH